MAGRRLEARRAAIRRFARPIQQFIDTEVSGGLVLVAGAALALLWANSPWHEGYEHLVEEMFSIDLGFYSREMSFRHWVNDGAMTLFFLLVGLEIKRELAVGELSDLRRAVVPVSAAVGGMVAPALIYLLIVDDPALRGGWGIPIATDIAFVLGVLALLGSRIPSGLKVFLLALAIVDDILAIIVIAVFYTESISLAPVVLAVAMLGLALVFQRAGIWYTFVYVVLGVIAWVALLESGVHPTLAGVAFGLATPATAWYQPAAFREAAESLLARFAQGEVAVDEVAGDEHERHEQEIDALLQLESIAAQSVSPLERVEDALHQIVAFVIVPVFAFANAGVVLGGETLPDAMTASVTWGVLAGLVLGKPLGILAATWLAVRAGAPLPAGVRWPLLAGAGILAGIGFTVSLFIAELSFRGMEALTDAKVGILGASLIAGAMGYLTLLATTRPGGATVEGATAEGLARAKAPSPATRG